ncbi:MAG: alpha/beta fold hydrolase [Cypionkella sp.]|nr:alpha/beta fold hydrolase [Cypionkella sp.]
MHRLVAALAVVVIALSLWRLEGARAGVEIAPLVIDGGPPVTLYHLPEARPAPVVVIAHGFAGSRQIMESYALTLARAGYLVASFDFMGHGRNMAPMRGDVGRIDGTTRLLVEETQAVARAALAHPLADGRLAFLGHSMASDIVIRAAMANPTAEAVVAISMFSQAVTATSPPNLLILPGEWEPHLRDEGLRVLRLSDPAAGEGAEVGTIENGTARKVFVAPRVEHVGVLYSTAALAETVAWLDRSFGRLSQAEPVARGPWIMALLAGIAALGWPLSRLLPKGAAVGARLPARQFWLAVGLPALVVPLALAPFDVRLLPVLVADYLALHLAAYGALTLGLLAYWGALRGQFPPRVWAIALACAVFGIGLIGGGIERYFTSFYPHSGRAVVILGLALGAVPFGLGDAVLTEGGRAALWRVLVVRGAFLGSLILAVMLNFDRLMFLLIILPVIVVYFLMFGTAAGWVGRRTGLPAGAGLGFGLVLAWSIGVVFPMFAA